MKPTPVSKSNEHGRDALDKSAPRSVCVFVTSVLSASLLPLAYAVTIQLGIHKQKQSLDNL